MGSDRVSTDLPEPLCRECADERSEEYERKGRFRNSPGRRVSVRCEECNTPLGSMYRPVEAGS